ncbi:hypothetical protein [Nocardia sp. Marseille-Q1738]
MNATITHTARRLLSCAVIIGALTAGAAGVTAAEPRSNPSDPRNGTGDDHGWTHIDPMGQHHRNSDRLEANAADQARRDYHQRQSQPGPSDTVTGNNSNSSTWSRTTRPDGSGYTVCKPHASWCR